ncbi:hypothetical protein [Leptospira licerasiae]|uniref:DUF7738 domain-containing protein n=1 Tax=Leptospira licerasiae str. MMD4847 TaxID=1049971 RepID=A0ABN0HE42_9LEPT|nr:hypothetical protein [Leptospira licerasiae]EIE03470.1 hypothetical protein LEP1GSC185_3541 [Leptospira licerasiae serovar Varillal str. VAR 010]EJZ43691.1 hypothetical protein LEP1GSC178_2353 [Leptospira licerasiae str. MMD4847]
MTSQNKLQISVILFFTVFSFELFSIDIKDLSITLSEEKTIISDWEIPGKVSIKEFVDRIGESDRKLDEESKIIYIWDKFGLSVQANKKSQLVDQLSVFGVAGSKENEPKSKYSGKLLFQSQNPDSNTLTSRGIFCMLTIGKRKLFGLCNAKSQNLEKLMISFE